MRPAAPALAGLVLAALLAGCREPAPPRVPDAVRGDVVRAYAAVGIGADRVDRTPGLFEAVELTSQAEPDWLVDFGKLPDGRLCGTGGCPVQVWVKIGKAPYALALERQALGHEAMGHESGRRWLALDLHGVSCGGTGSEACRYNFEWRGNADDAEGYFAAASVWGRPRRYRGPLLQALPVRPPPGSPIAAAATAYRAACLAVGGEADLATALARLPDLNGDGRPEWLFDADQALCLADGEPKAPACVERACETRLYSQSADGAWRETWSSAPVAYAVDFSRPLARLLVRPAACAPDCPERPLVWRDAGRRFVAASGGGR